MNIRPKHILVTAIICVAVVAYFGARYGMDKYKDYLSDKEYAAKIDTIDAHMFYPLKENSHMTFDRIHAFVRDNSQHKIDDEFRANWSDRMKLADAFIAGLEGKRSDKPHMECSTRSNLLAALLAKKGYRTRNVVMYSPEENLRNHRIIEVLNPETKHWEAYDVTYDVFYKNIKTGARASAAAVGAMPDDHQPCNTKGRCGWNLVADSGEKARALRNYLKIITINDPETNLRLTLHAPDTVPDRIYKTPNGNGTFCDVFPKNCQQGFMPYAEGLEASGRT